MSQWQRATDRTERLQSEQKPTTKADAKCHLSRAIFCIFYAGESKTRRKSLNFGVADGTRTHDNRNHNPGLYQLSYSHH